MRFQLVGMIPTNWNVAIKLKLIIPGIFTHIPTIALSSGIDFWEVKPLYKRFNMNLFNSLAFRALAEYQEKNGTWKPFQSWSNKKLFVLYPEYQESYKRGATSDS